MSPPALLLTTQMIENNRSLTLEDMAKLQENLRVELVRGLAHGLCPLHPPSDAVHQLVPVQVHVPVGGDPCSSTNDTTWVLIELLVDPKTLRKWRDLRMIWSEPSQHNLLRHVKLDVLSFAAQEPRTALRGVVNACKQRTYFKGEMLFGTCRTMMYNIGALSFVVTHVLAHLPSMHKQEEKPEEEKAEEEKPRDHFEHSAVIWAFWSGKLLQCYDACNVRTLVAKLMSGSNQVMQYTLSVLRLQGTPPLFRSPAEVDDIADVLQGLPLGKSRQQLPPFRGVELPLDFALRGDKEEDEEEDEDESMTLCKMLISLTLLPRQKRACST